MMRILSVLLIASFLICLAACGGSSQSTPQNPVFTSTPVTNASQGTSYTYSLAAADPSGGTVSFSLITAPTGATLTGHTITWEPTAAESRISNSFTAKATSSSGGSATQSWTVTPTGTVTVNWVNTDWTPAGPVALPAPPSRLPSALVPQPDGSLQLMAATAAAPGVFNIGQVPGGYYWLIEGGPPGFAPTAFWTNSSSFDLGRDIAGGAGAVGPSQTTTFDFTLSGLDPSETPGVVGFLPNNLFTPPIYLAAQPGSTDLSESVSVTGGTDWTQVNTAFLAQLEPTYSGPFNELVLGPELTLSDLTLTNGTTNTISGTLAPSPQAFLDAFIAGAEWTSVFQNVAPGTPTPLGSWLSIAPEPYVIGVNAKPQLLAPSIVAIPYMVQPADPSGLPFPINGCPSWPFFMPDSAGPAVVSDQVIGVLAYGDPFPSNWMRQLSFCQSVTVPFTVGSMTFPIALNYGITVDPTTSPLAPRVWPVVSPTIDGSNLFTTTSENNTVVTLNWSASAGLSVYGYTVAVFQVIPIQNGLELLNAGIYSTAQTSMTLPPLVAGNTYIFLIITQADAIANMQTSPYRSQLPTAFASVMSAQVTINGGASGPQLRGDPKELRRFLSPKGERYRITTGSPVTRVAP